MYLILIVLWRAKVILLNKIWWRNGSRCLCFFTSNRETLKMCENWSQEMLFCTLLVLKWTRSDFTYSVMENAVVVWNAPLLLSCFWENMRMISSECNNDKFSEHDARAIISILFKEIQRGYSNIVCWVNVHWGTNVKPARAHTQHI